MMHTLLALLLFVVVFVVPNQVAAEDAEKDVDKRQVSALARDGHLPYTGKRYAEDEENESESKSSGVGWESDHEPSVFLMTNKRYVGALAKTGDLTRYKQVSDKRDDMDTLIDELLTELRKIRLEALREELLRREDEELVDDLDADKRSLASLARAGGIHFRNEKRSIASMAKSGYLRAPSSFAPNDFYKRGISSLARSGQLPYFGKRGGISSLMRNGYSHQKRGFDSDNDGFLLDDYDVDDKRNVAALARDRHLPFSGKRNIASFARNGWLQDFRQSSKKSANEFWDDTLDEYKRNIPSLLRNRGSLVQGKRYLGSFVANNGLPYTKSDNGALERSWGKRELYDDDEISNDELANLYIASLLNEAPETDDSFHSDEADGLDEQKRHIGSFLAQKTRSLVMRKKKSITPEDQFGEPQPTPTPKKQNNDENRMNNDIQQNHRQKREADFMRASGEFTMPVMQSTEWSDYEEGNSRASGEQQSTRKKRYFAVRGGGKIPGGRLPHVGRSRSNNPNSGRRRGGH